jgi:hypothetical protein
LNDVYYAGSKEEWKKISIGSYNEPLTNATIHYNGGTVRGTCGDDLMWKLDDEGTLTISGTGDMTNYASGGNAPWYSRRESIKRVVIESGVTSIGDNAFYGCTSLTSIEIPNSVTGIGDNAFYGCTKLTSVIIPDGVTSIGDNAFYGCTKLISVTIGNSVTDIWSYAFYKCYSLASVTIPNSVTRIGYMAFYECESLNDVYYAGSEEEWKKISIGKNNDYLTNAKIHCNGSTTVEIVASGDFEGVAKWTIDSDDVLSVAFDEEVKGTPVIMSLKENGEAESISVVNGTNGTVDVSDTKTVKIFVWDSFQSMKPLCEAKEIKVNQ